jgi:hypothetical protein
MTDITYNVQQLNDEIIAAHKKHYENSATGLIQPKESPNGNIIYHLYSDGTITYQKGGFAYLQRSVFEDEYALKNHKKINLKLINDAPDGTTYVILTQDECNYFREKMDELINK